MKQSIDADVFFIEADAIETSVLVAVIGGNSGGS